MTDTVFITGDRMMSPLYPALVSVEMLKAASLGLKIATGTNTGVEELVRGIAQLAGIPVDLIEHVEGANGKPDWDERHARLGDTPVVFVHTDPLDSRVGASLMASLEDDQLRIVTPADLLV